MKPNNAKIFAKSGGKSQEVYEKCHENDRSKRDLKESAKRHWFFKRNVTDKEYEKDIEVSLTEAAWTWPYV